MLVFAWLVVLMLGGLGLAPVADLPFAEVLRPSKGPEPLTAVPKPRKPLPEDLKPALPRATPTTAPAGAPAASQPRRSIRQEPSRSERRFVPKERRSPRRAPRQPVTPPTPVQQA